MYVASLTKKIIASLTPTNCYPCNLITIIFILFVISLVLPFCTSLFLIYTEKITLNIKMAFRLTICFRSLTLSDALRTSQTKIPTVATIVNPCRNLSLLSTISNISRLEAITGNGALSQGLKSQQREQEQPQQQQQRQQQQRRLFSALSRLDFYLDPIYFGSPLKKKRKIDPAVLRRREDRIRGKINRALGRLGKYADKLKPVDEYDVPRMLVKQVSLC